jgi:hypothetical protein
MEEEEEEVMLSHQNKRQLSDSVHFASIVKFTKQHVGYNRLCAYCMGTRMLKGFRHLTMCEMIQYGVANTTVPT